jgi:hypothetical protein
MGHTRGRVTEIRMQAGGQMDAFIACPAVAVPMAGQYLLASNMQEPAAVLATPLFLAQKSVLAQEHTLAQEHVLAQEHTLGFWAAPPLPVSWRPGIELDLVGPFGHGFDLPREVQRLAWAETAGA